MTIRSGKRQLIWLASGCAVWFMLIGFEPFAQADAGDLTTVHVVVEDAETGKPVYQAHLTLQFLEPQGKWRFKRPKTISYTAKTDLHGATKIEDVPLGRIRLIVTDPQHQTFGEDFEVKTENQVIKVKLKKPQPLL